MGCTERWSMLISIIFFSFEQTLTVLTHIHSWIGIFFCMGKRR